MPLYEFKCRKCGKRFEELLSSVDFSRVACPGCGASKPEKLLSVFGVNAAGSDKCAARDVCGGACRHKHTAKCGH